MTNNEFILKAEENLKAAELLFENGLYNASANRAYYASLQGASAALANAGIILKQIDHKATHVNFATELIQRRKIYPSRFKSYLPDMHRVRIDADYKSEPVSKKAASEQLKMAKEFVTQIVKEAKNV
jgi:uncharacterized protein (UPF0332 family)